MKQTLTNKMLGVCLALAAILGLQFRAQAQYTICSGSSITLNAQAGMASYTWNTGEQTASITVAPTTTTTYVCTEYDDQLNMITETFTVTVNEPGTNGCGNSGGGDTGGGGGGGGGGNTSNYTTCPFGAVTLNGQAGMVTYLWSTGEQTPSITLYPSANTVVTCEQIDANLLPVTETFNITVLASSDPTCSNSGGGGSGGTGGTTTTYNLTTCPKKAVTLDAGLGSAYAWNTGATTRTITVTLTASSSYTVQVTAGNGGIDTKIFDVTVLSSKNSLCSNGNNGWGNGDQDAPGNSGGNNNGENGGTSPRGIGKNGKGRLSGSKNMETIDFRVLENPFKNNFTLVLNGSSKLPVSVSVFDMAGRLVGDFKNLSSTETFTAGEDLQKGVYFVKVTQGDQTKMTKIVKSGN
jgi:hypothetical protein